MFLSAKFGQTSYLTHVPTSSESMTDEAVYYASLISMHYYFVLSINHSQGYVEFSPRMKLLTHDDAGKSPTKRVGGDSDVGPAFSSIAITLNCGA